MRHVKSDITAFNQHIRSLLDSLHARGETTNDLLTNLFKGYKAATDSSFTLYIQCKEEQFDDGENFTPEQLMNHACNKFITLSNEGRWNALSKADAKLVALRAELNHLKGLSAVANTKQGKDSTSAKQKRQDAPAWTKVAPKDGEAKTKTVDSRLYHWCHHHKLWVQHHPSDCQLDYKPAGSTGPVG